MTKSASKTTAAKSAAAKASDKPAAKKATKPAEAVETKSGDPVETQDTRPTDPQPPAGDPPVVPPKSNKKNPSIIRVRSKAPHFRRAGIEFNRDGIDIDVSELTAEQIDALNAEPNLVIDGGGIPNDGKAAE